MIDLELRLDVEDADTVLVSVSQAAAGSHRNELPHTYRFGRKALDDELRKVPADGVITTDLGRQLWHIVLGSDAAQMAANGLKAASTRQPVRLRVRIADPALARIPFEQLRVPHALRSSRPLAWKQDVFIIRDHAGSTPVLEAAGPLRFGIVASGDAEAPGLFADATVQLRLHLRSDLLVVEPLEEVSDFTWPEVVRSLSAAAPLDVVNIWCHGHRDGRIELASGALVGAQDIAAVLRDVGCRLAILQACNSAVPRPDAPGGLAGELVALGVPAVVAFSNSVRQKTSADFVLELNADLAEHPADAIDVVVKRVLMGPSHDKGGDNNDWAHVTVHFADDFDGVLRPEAGGRPAASRVPVASAAPLDGPAAAAVVVPVRRRDWAALRLGAAAFIAEGRSGQLLLRRMGSVTAPTALALGGTVGSVSCAEDGSALAAEVDGRLAVVSVAPSGAMTLWPDRFDPELRDWAVVGVRRCGSAVEALLVGADDGALVRADRSGRQRVHELHGLRLRGAAALTDGFSILDDDGELDSAGDVAVALGSLGGRWLDIDAAFGGGRTVVVALRGGDAPEVHVVVLEAGEVDRRVFPVEAGATNVAVLREASASRPSGDVVLDPGNGRSRLMRWDDLVVGV